jgi:hypothetical protein
VAPVQYALLLSEDHDECLSLLTGLQILATSARGTALRRLARLNATSRRHWLRVAWTHWKEHHQPTAGKP